MDPLQPHALLPELQKEDLSENIFNFSHLPHCFSLRVSLSRVCLCACAKERGGEREREQEISRKVEEDRGKQQNSRERAYGSGHVCERE